MTQSDELKNLLKYLVDRDDDKAKEENGIGLDKFDTEDGHALIEQKNPWNIKQMKLALRICEKHRKQFPSDLRAKLDAITVESLVDEAKRIDTIKRETLKELKSSDNNVEDPNIIKVVVSQEDHIYGEIKNGDEGCIRRISQPTNSNPLGVTVLLRFKGILGPVIRIDDKLGLQFDLLDEKDTMSLDDFMTYIKHRFSLKGNSPQYLREIFEAWIGQSLKDGKVTDYFDSPISVVDDIITVRRETTDDIAQILKKIRRYYEYASHQGAFVSALGWSLIAPLHYELKKRSQKGIQTPLMLEEGKTKGGKTPLGVLFIGKGYDQDREDFFYPYERIGTRFTFAKALMKTNLPMIADDVSVDWIFKNKESLKSYVQTGVFFNRGRSDQTLNEGKGKRSLFITVNEDRRVDDDLALTLRLHVDRYTESNTKRKDKARYDEFFNSLPQGFMLDIFKSIFDGKKNLRDIK